MFDGVYNKKNNPENDTPFTDVEKQFEIDDESEAAKAACEIPDPP